MLGIGKPGDLVGGALPDEKEVWLIYYRKQADKPRILTTTPVEEALCFGWIDSTVKHLDDERIAQRFSLANPRADTPKPTRRGCAG